MDLTPQEADALKLAFHRCRGNRPTTAAQLNTVLEWAKQTKTAFVALAAVLDGHLSVDLDDSGEVVFEVTPEGDEYLSEIGLPEPDGREMQIRR
jgi:hypothetical protein